jgi:MFS family permease
LCKSTAATHDGRVRARTPTPDAATPDGVWTPGRRALTLGLVFTITLVGFEGLAIATILKVIDDDLHDIGLLGWVFSAFFLGSLFGVVAAGYDADRKGPARPFVAGLVLFAVGLLAGGVAPNMLVLVGARFVQGVGAGAIPAVAYVAIGRAYPPELQPRMFAVLSSAWVLPGVIGPGISGAVAAAFGWRWVFLGLLPLVALAAVMTTRALHTLGPPGGDAPVDRRVEALTLVVGAGLVLAGVSSHSAIATPALVIVGILVGARAFLRVVPRGTVRLERGMPAAVALRGLTTFAFFGTDAFVAFTVTSLRHGSIALGGIALTAATLTWTTGSWIQERLVQRVGPQRFVRVGLLVIACGIGIMIAVAQSSVPAATAVLAWGVAGLGMGLAYAPLTLVVLAEAPPGAEGSATAAMQLCDTLGVALGTGVSGAIVAAGATLTWSRGTALTVAFALCATVAVIAAVAAMRLPALIHRQTNGSNVG